MTLELITEVKAGQAVPEWLIYVDPNTPDAIMPKMTFMVDCAIALVGDKYWVLPSVEQIRDRGVRAVIFAEEGQGCNIGALVHDLVIPNSFTVMRAIEGATL